MSSDLLIHDSFFGIWTALRFDAIRARPLPAVTKADGGLSHEQQHSLYRNQCRRNTDRSLFRFPVLQSDKVLGRFWDDQGPEQPVPK
jgi:hypothetical protein